MKAAESKGADVRLESELKNIVRKDSKVKINVMREGKMMEIESRVLIGCDGVTSVVSRKFFNRSQYDIIPSIQYKMLNYL